MPTIMDAIRSDHARHRRILDALVETHGDTDERRELFYELYRELQAHAAAEERLFYAALLGYEESRARAAHSVSEHEEVRSQLEELAELSFSSPSWLVKLKAIKEAAEHHMDEEEDEIFPLASRVLGEQRQRDLASAFLREKSEMTVSLASREYEARLE